MDRLLSLLDRIPLSAYQVFAGDLCYENEFDISSGLGSIHVVKEGVLVVKLDGGHKFEITEPSLLFFPRAFKHIFDIIRGEKVVLTCALVDIGHGVNNPLVSSLPDHLIIPFSSSKGIEKATSLLFDEAFSDKYGRQASMDRQFEYIVILILRHLIETKSLNYGLFAGLSDEKLARALSIIHDNPEKELTLNDLAKASGMSRSVFVNSFKKTVGLSPMSYISDWRISIATKMLKTNVPITEVAYSVGYTDVSAFSRAFSIKTGLSPRNWLKNINPINHSVDRNFGFSPRIKSDET
jgi:AraC-like DNA-binding protein